MGKKSSRQNSGQNTKSKQLPKMCLNMIVKNEAHVIVETLTNILPHIDYWVICDTGSTDGTQQLIKDFFLQKNIPGELVDHEWKNFGYNRTKAFEAAFNKSEYVWVIDADDLIVGDLSIPKKLDKDLYLLKYGGVNLCYPRGQIFSNKLKWVYRGVLHEFAVCSNKSKPSMEKIDGEYYIDSRRLGDRNKDKEKYLKDAQVLLKAIEDKVDPDLESRYYFYVGQSYRDYNDLDNAIKYYRIRTKLGGWNEEIAVSFMEIGLALVRKNGSKSEIISAFMDGFKAMPSRAECLFFLANHYYKEKDYANAYKTCRVASKIPNPTNLLLFIKTDIHLYKCKELLFALCIIILNNKIEIKNISQDQLKAEAEELHKYLTTSPNVPNEIKQKMSGVKLDWDNMNMYKEPPELSGYVLVKELDSFGDDIGNFPNSSMEELVDIVDLYDNCVAFNTYGYLKHSINLPLIPLRSEKYITEGIYIKKDLAEKIFKEYGTNLSALKQPITIGLNPEMTNKSTSNDNSKEINFTMPTPIKVKEVKGVKENDYDSMGYDYNDAMVKKIIEHVNTVKPENKLITLTITTCKRLNLFKRTMNSLINNCTDILMIDQYICVDDNSSESDRNEMKKLFPFFTWILKSDSERGHMQSMNIICRTVKTKYMFHTEDDWLFCRNGEYIRPALEILNQKTVVALELIPENRNIPRKKIAQVVFNKNYTELQEIEVGGGFLCETLESKFKYLIHEHYDPEKENELFVQAIKKYTRSAVYWPHFSLHPSIINTEIFADLGDFTYGGFFERGFANKYYNSGYITCFFDSLSVRHIGKLLSQRGNPDIKNAYELNDVNQFVHVPNKPKINWEFYPNKDLVGFDILHVGGKTPEQLMEIANKMPNCVAFNTLGYFKHTITDLDKFIFLPNLVNNVDGLFVKKNV